MTDDEILAIADAENVKLRIHAADSVLIVFARSIAAAEREQIVVTLQDLYKWWRDKDEELGIVGTRPWEFDVIAAIRERSET